LGVENVKNNVNMADFQPNKLIEAQV
jgi:hypothetical protein